MSHLKHNRLKFIHCHMNKKGLSPRNSKEQDACLKFIYFIHNFKKPIECIEMN